jgi:hypothetical protein
MASKQLKFFNSRIIFWETRTLSRLIIAIKSTACFRKKINVLIKCRVINAARSESWDVAQRELNSPRSHQHHRTLLLGGGTWGGDWILSLTSYRVIINVTVTTSLCVAVTTIGTFWSYRHGQFQFERIVYELLDRYSYSLWYFYSHSMSQMQFYELQTSSTELLLSPNELDTSRSEVWA